MTAIAWSLPRDAAGAFATAPIFSRELIDWRMLKLAFTLFLYSFGYGGDHQLLGALRGLARRDAQGRLLHRAARS